MLDPTQFDTILREDSTMILPQAGTYTGPTAFMEYIKFGTSVGDYFSHGPAINAYVDRFNGYDAETDTCEYLMTYQAEYHLDDQFATLAQHVNVTFMIKFHMAYSEGPALKNAIYYYTSDWLTYLFDDMLNNDKVALNICHHLVDSCNNTVDGLPQANCLEKFNNLPVLNSDRAHVDGNSKGCRELHVVMAEMDPKGHCPHIAYTPTEDPEGRIKCQESQELQPEDYFTQDDFDFFNRLQETVGVDPIRGFKLKEEYETEANITSDVVPDDEAELNFILDKTRCDFMYKDRKDGIDYFNVLDPAQYDSILNQDSAVILPQAGTFAGPDGFLEYVKFTSSLGDYFSYGPAINTNADTFNGYDPETDTCEYLMAYQAEYHMDDKLATLAQELNVTFMIKFQMSYEEGPILKNVIVYYTNGYLTFLFDDMLNNDKVANRLCDQMINSCDNTHDGVPHESCLDKFHELPVMSGEGAHVDGNSKGCRALHLVMVGSSPDMHCPHIAYSPTFDLVGKIKCQASQGMQPQEYFTQEDFYFFTQFQMSVEVDPWLGYKLEETYEVGSDGSQDNAAVESSMESEGSQGNVTLDSESDEEDESSEDGANTSVMFGIIISGIVLALLLFVYLSRSKPPPANVGYKDEDEESSYR